MTFSERFGAVAARDVIQGRDLDDKTRLRLWAVVEASVPTFHPEDYADRKRKSRLPDTWMWQVYHRVWTEILLKPADELEKRDDSVGRQAIKQILLEGQWFEVYDLLELIFRERLIRSNEGEFVSRIDQVLREEMAGFRAKGVEFVEVTGDGEIEAIDEALSAATNEFSPAREHLATALRKLSDRKSPDYRNSVKESISAVESVAQVVTGDPSATLGAAVKALHGEDELPKALRDAFSKLYGYTSGSDGIRHALTDGDRTVDAATAKFMLVVCSAFVSYLIEQYSKKTP